jgi:hypothetical protein
MVAVLFQKRFIPPLLAGTKRQTIRPRRKRPIQIGERLSLRHWEDVAYRSPQVEVLTVEVIGVLPIKVFSDGIQINGGPVENGQTELDAFAHNDGFPSWAEMLAYFRFGGYGLPFEGDLILFDANP